VPSVRLKTFGGRRFGVVGPAIWNSLPDYLKDPNISFDTFRKHLKNMSVCTLLVRRSSALEAFLRLLRYTNLYCIVLYYVKSSDWLYYMLALHTVISRIHRTA